MLKQTITQEQALLLIGQVVDIITSHVPDKQVLANVVLDLQRLMDKAGVAYALHEAES
jgi:hypothetical protein